MTKRRTGVLLFLLFLVIVLLIAVSRLNQNRITPNSGVPGLTTVENNAVASNWARDLLSKYPHINGAYSGVEPTKTRIEVWLIGRKTTSSDPNTISLESMNVSHLAKLITSPIYTSQTADIIDDKVLVSSIKPEEIKTGDFIAVRVTYLDNGILALEVRKLIRE